jgi:hypothetical protein
VANDNSRHDARHGSRNSSGKDIRHDFRHSTGRDFGHGTGLTRPASSAWSNPPGASPESEGACHEVTKTE